MIFWLSILAGGFCAWYALKMGFYETWTMLFNIVISVYVAIFLTPLATEFIPGASDTLYGLALAILAIAVGCFLILHGISYIFLTGQFSVSFPKLFDILFAGFLGFLGGFLIFSFLIFLIAVTPLSADPLLGKVGFDKQCQQSNISYICWWCDLVHSFVSTQENKITAEQAISKLLKGTQSKQQLDAKPAEHESAEVPLP
jgi:hypothetical protein